MWRDTGNALLSVPGAASASLSSPGTRCCRSPTIELMSELASSRTDPRFHRSTFSPLNVCRTVSSEGCRRLDAVGVVGTATGVTAGTAGPAAAG